MPGCSPPEDLTGKGSTSSGTDVGYGDYAGPAAHAGGSCDDRTVSMADYDNLMQYESLLLDALQAERRKSAAAEAAAASASGAAGAATMQPPAQLGAVLAASAPAGAGGTTSTVPGVPRESLLILQQSAA